jgi:hypothetical protein
VCLHTIQKPQRGSQGPTWAVAPENNNNNNNNNNNVIGIVMKQNACKVYDSCSQNYLSMFRLDHETFKSRLDSLMEHK